MDNCQPLKLKNHHSDLLSMDVLKAVTETCFHVSNDDEVFYLKKHFWLCGWVSCHKHEWTDDQIANLHAATI